MKLLTLFKTFQMILNVNISYKRHKTGIFMWLSSTLLLLPFVPEWFYEKRHS